MCQWKFTTTQIVSMLKEPDVGRPPFGLTMGPNSSGGGDRTAKHPTGETGCERLYRTRQSDVSGGSVERLRV